MFQQMSYPVSFVYYSGCLEDVKDTDWSTYDFIHFNEALDQVDVMVFGMFHPPNACFDLFRQKGIKMVYYCMGNTYTTFLEGCIHQSKDQDMASIKPKMDAIWTLPHHFKYHRFIELIDQCPCVEVPYLWHPSLIEKYAKLHDLNGYQPSSEKFLGVFEPNMSTLKHCIQPLINIFGLNPDDFIKAYFFCTDELKTSNVFKQFVLGLPISSKLFFEGRYAIVYLLKKFVNIPIAYQKENELNNLYFDVLWLGFPLIHNSSKIKDLGFYYETKEEFVERYKWVKENFDAVHEEMKQLWRKKITEKYFFTNSYIQSIYKLNLEKLGL
jgi:hypothetical protein